MAVGKLLPPTTTKRSIQNPFKTLALILISIIITSLLFYNDLLSLSFSTYYYALPTSSSIQHHVEVSKSKDYNKYVWSKNILPQWDPTSNNRLIAIGDIHGMLHSLKKLLKQINYNPRVDTVVLVGDLAAKHPKIQSSLDTIRFCRESKLESIRGNHDQYIIIWRNWMEDHRDEFIEPKEIQNYKSDQQATLESDRWLNTPSPPETLKHKLPEGMKWKAQHFEIARLLPKVDFIWMMERSLTIYVPPLRIYFVHAGMLPWDLPSVMGTEGAVGWHQPSLLDVKENQDAYTLLEMRGLKKGKKPTQDGTKGKPWFKYWNNVMTFSNQTLEVKDKKPHHVVYGHWASKGLTIQPWSTGLDSGCVFGRKMSALVIGQENTSVEKHKKLKVIPVPIHKERARIFQIPCHEP